MSRSLSGLRIGIGPRSTKGGDEGSPGVYRMLDGDGRVLEPLAVSVVGGGVGRERDG